jgi:hypothetical protein
LQDEPEVIRDRGSFLVEAASERLQDFHVGIQADSIWRHAMRIVVRPVMEPQLEIDVTQRLVAAIAEELWRVCGGNDHLNWIEAELHLRRIVGEARIAAAIAKSTHAGNGSGRSAGALPVESRESGRRHQVKRRPLIEPIDHSEEHIMKQPMRVCLDWIRRQLELTTNDPILSLAEVTCRWQCAIELYQALKPRPSRAGAHSRRLRHQHDGLAAAQVKRELNGTIQY